MLPYLGLKLDILLFLLFDRNTPLVVLVFRDVSVLLDYFTLSFGGVLVVMPRVDRDHGLNLAESMGFQLETIIIFQFFIQID
jgi:hypothetical protein